jgi:hypothetical protein
MHQSLSQVLAFKFDENKAYMNDVTYAFEHFHIINYLIIYPHYQGNTNMNTITYANHVILISEVHKERCYKLLPQ